MEVRLQVFKFLPMRRSIYSYTKMICTCSGKKFFNTIILFFITSLWFFPNKSINNKDVTFLVHMRTQEVRFGTICTT